MAGIPLKVIANAAFPGIKDEFVSQLCSLAANYHLDEVEFGYKLEALQVNEGNSEFTDMTLGKLKQMVVADAARSAGNKENQRVRRPVVKEPVAPKAEPSVFSTRTDSGQVLLSFRGPNSGPVEPLRPSVELLTETPAGYFYNAAQAKTAHMNKRLSAFKEQYKEMYEREIEERVSKVSEIEMTVVGRVVSEDGAKLSAANLCLQDKSNQVDLDVSGMPDFLLYPGKILAAVGRCNSLKFSAESILPLPASPKKEKDVGQSVHAIVACGPYSATENLDYEPLMTLLSVAQREACGCLVLCGPFLDADHPKFREEPTPRSGVFGDNYTYEEALDILIQKVVERKLNCAVIVVPSVQDLAQMTPVPQRPYSSCSDPSVFMATNPCCFTLNGLLFGVSTVDVLREIAMGCFARSTHQANRIKQAFNEVLEQRCFLPFSPSETPVDMQHADLLHLSASPDVLIVASKMAKCVEALGDTLCVNPGPLTRGNDGGSYVRIQVSAGDVSVRERTQVEIIQI